MRGLFSGFAGARSSQAELMDDLSIQGPELEETLLQIETINRTLGGNAPSLFGLARLVPRHQKRVTVLDVGTGGGALSRRIIAFLEERGHRPEVTAIDLSETSVRFARRRSAPQGNLRFEVRDLFDLPNEPSYDVVHAAAVLHHFPGDSALGALKRMVSLSRLGVVVNDLHRHPVAYYGIKALTRAFSRNRLIRNDAPLSVRRGFMRAELRRLAEHAGVDRVEISWRPMFRWVVVAHRAGPGASRADPVARTLGRPA